jgi:hypothetical protein
MARKTSGVTRSAFDAARLEEDGVWVPPVVDLSVPSVSRIYDFLLGGKDNFAVDRAAVQRIVEAVPRARLYAVANRTFVRNVVTAMARTGIDQFIDFGAGLPTSPSVHEIAHAVNPSAVVAYLDSDPVVLVHNRALLAGNPGVVCLPHDLRQPQVVIDDPQLRRLIDLDRPVGLLFSAVLHFVRHDRAPDIVARYASVVPSGSMIAISAVCRDGVPPQVVNRVEGQFARANAGMTFRTRAQIEELFDGYALEDPGLVSPMEWRTEGASRRGPGALCGLGRKL